MKTGKDIQRDIIRLIKGSPLAQGVTGQVYLSGTRPRDSRKEDITVAFITGQTAQIERGIVSVMVWVHDIDPFADGVFVEDSRRIAQLERLSADWVDSLTAEGGCYLFSLSQTITSLEDPEARQHFIVIKLQYKYFE